MKIIVQTSNQLDLITEFMNFNSILHEQMDLYDTIESLIRIPPLLDNTLIIMDFNHFADFIECDISHKSFVDYTSDPNNKIWVFGKNDFLLRAIHNQPMVEKIDQLVKHRNVTFYFESPATDDCFLKKLKNIQVNSLPYNWHMCFPRIEQSLTNKINCKYNFLLTMVRNGMRPHREILWKQLNDKPHLLEKSISVYHNKIKEPWIGSTPSLHHWRDGHPSMDLYNDCWFEIVPETMHRYGYFITEKTIKPLATKTPFVIVSTPGYLKFLQQNGFQTFHTIINERYDAMSNLNDRICAVVDQVEYIIKNGSENFYQASIDILTHNQNRLLELTGRYQFDIDVYLNQQFSNLKI